MSKTNNITVGTMENSQIQQDTKSSNQIMDQSSFDIELKSFLENFLRDISKVSDKKTAEALHADAETIKAQVDAPAPQKGIIKECLFSIKNILEGATGSILASYIPVITPLIACL